MGIGIGAVYPEGSSLNDVYYLFPDGNRFAQVKNRKGDVIYANVFMERGGLAVSTGDMYVFKRKGSIRFDLAGGGKLIVVGNVDSLDKLKRRVEEERVR